MARDVIKAIALLTANDVERLGATLDHLYPIEAGGPFEDLLVELDRIDYEIVARTSAEARREPDVCDDSVSEDDALGRAKPAERHG